MPPASIGGHVTHHGAGCAGLYGLEIHAAPVDAEGYTVDVEALRALAFDRCGRSSSRSAAASTSSRIRSREVRAIADEVGALVLFDAAHHVRA